MDTAKLNLLCGVLLMAVISFTLAHDDNQLFSWNNKGHKGHKGKDDYIGVVYLHNNNYGGSSYGGGGGGGGYGGGYGSSSYGTYHRVYPYRVKYLPIVHHIPIYSYGEHGKGKGKGHH